MHADYFIFCINEKIAFGLWSHEKKDKKNPDPWGSGWW